MVAGWPDKYKVRKPDSVMKEDRVQPTRIDQFGLKPALHKDSLRWLNGETDWKVAPLSDAARIEITRAFAAQLVERYGVAADVAIHAPHREGDQRNHHAHILTITRVLSPNGLIDKARILDAASTGGPEIEAMRGYWAELQNHALELAGQVERVDHRPLEVQREVALSLGDNMRAEELDREPKLKCY
jgi:hypothetical protein